MAMMLTAAPTPKTETIVLAAGCFGGMPDILRRIPGLLSPAVGYPDGNLQ